MASSCARRCTISLRTLSLYGLLLGSAPLHAAQGEIDRIWASPSSQFVMFSLRPASKALARCNTSNRYSINLSERGGSATLETLLLAAREQLPVEVESLNTCNGYDAENIKFIVIDTAP
ncbi:MAG: hypothetical protein AAF513_05310 [Pseudomonadota bacterium]